MTPHLKALEAHSIYIIREAYATIDRLGLLWSMGKDSTVMLWLVKKAFLGRIPFPVILLDTGMEMDEVYAFRDEMIAAWGLDVIAQACPPIEEADQSLPPSARAAMRKTLGLRAAITDKKLAGVFCGIRRDEQGLRAKERVFSPRDAEGNWNFKDQPAELWDQYQTNVPEGSHLRIHPLLHWNESDIWAYIKAQDISVCDLYFARDGMRYRSLGEKDTTLPTPSTATTLDDIIAELNGPCVSERAGRTIDTETETSFERLRAQGYL